MIQWLKLQRVLHPATLWAPPVIQYCWRLTLSFVLQGLGSGSKYTKKKRKTRSKIEFFKYYWTYFCITKCCENNIPIFFFYMVNAVQICDWVMRYLIVFICAQNFQLPTSLMYLVSQAGLALSLGTNIKRYEFWRNFTTKAMPCHLFLMGDGLLQYTLRDEVDFASQQSFITQWQSRKISFCFVTGPKHE